MRSLRSPVFALSFCLTGVGSAMLGATLPATLHTWRLSDSSGGLLLLAAWGGSTAGALLARGTGQISAALGLLLSAASLFGLALPQPPAPLLLFLLYGLGLGTTMTSISLLRAREVTAANADVELNRLNLLWAAGACAAPALAAHSLRLLSVSGLFRFLGVTFLVGSVAAFVMSGVRVSTSGPTQAASARVRLPWAPLRFGLFAAASVGLESAIGSWLTTYAQRVTLGVTVAVSADAAFWVGLLLSRAAHSVKAARWLHTRAARWLHLAATGTATGLLILFPDRGVLPAAGLLCGFGLGPLYPYVLSVALPRYRSTTVFVMAGVGASLTPWLTGALSSHFHSLRVGLVAPGVAFLVLLTTGLTLSAEST